MMMMIVLYTFTALIVELCYKVMLLIYISQKCLAECQWHQTRAHKSDMSNV